MAQAGTEAGSAGGVWPAAVVHVNEDGWVLLNRGAGQGVAPGMRLLVVGDEARDLYDTSSVATSAEPRALVRIRRTYELLEVVHADEQSAVAIAARVPRERRPQVYRAPGGELLVWVPLPPNYTWPGAAPSDDAAADAGDDAADEQDLDEGTEDLDGAGDEDEGDQPEAAATGAQDAEALAEAQEDERWEQALPLNGIHVGDLVLPAIPVPASGAAASHSATDAGATPVEQQDTPFDSGRDYDWLKPPS